MNVRVCGPNLNNQRKGSFHVHSADCNDLNYYGPGRREGGDEFGPAEMLVKDATRYKIIEATYSDQISENVSDETSREDVAKDYESDFWFAPCCAEHLPWRTGIVYECWVNTDASTFAKLKSDDKFGVANWLMNVLTMFTPHSHIHIVAHNEDEYDEA